MKYVQNRTAFKNRCQKVLNRVNIRLRSKLSDVFGKGGMEILNGLMAGKTVECILEQTENKWLKTRCDEIKAVAKGALSETDIFELKKLTETIKHLDEQITDGSAKIDTRQHTRDIESFSAVRGGGSDPPPPFWPKSATPKRFSNGKQIASWTGLAPSVYQSAGASVTGPITKQGSKWLRWNMVEVAHGAVRVRDSRFRALFLRVHAKKGKELLMLLWLGRC